MKENMEINNKSTKYISHQIKELRKIFKEFSVNNSKIEKKENVVIEKEKNYRDQKNEKLLDNLEENINVLILENSRLREEKLLSLADAENSKRVMKEEIQNIKKYGLVSLVKKILPVLDNFDRALSVSDKIENKAVKNFLLGFSMIMKHLTLALKEVGVEEIKASIGDKYDSNIHLALSSVETKKYPAGSITEVLQKGYKISERVIRPSSVNVEK